MRKFAVVKDEFLKYGVSADEIKIPVRATRTSVAYDVYSPIDEVIPAGETKTIFSNLKAYFNDDEVLYLATTSGMGKRGLMLAQGIGVIESDYADNVSNDGNLGFMLYNHSDNEIVIKKGDKIGQCWFAKFLVVDDEVPPTGVRTGGFGSTKK
ncbi:MAG: dUTP diphosphatase [Clostridia bacterium]|nr:dUTP diphosphatase [Clostridia bacterium]